MPDEPRPALSIQGILNTVLLIITALTGLAAAVGTIVNRNTAIDTHALTVENHTRGEAIEKDVKAVQTVQAENVVKTDAVAADLTKATAKIEAKATDDVEVQRALLYGNWFYLNEQAVTVAEKARAIDARKLFDDFERKNPPKKK